MLTLGSYYDERDVWQGRSDDGGYAGGDVGGDGGGLVGW